MGWVHQNFVYKNDFISIKKEQKHKNKIIIKVDVKIIIMHTEIKMFNFKW